MVMENWALKRVQGDGAGEPYGRTTLARHVVM